MMLDENERFETLAIIEKIKILNARQAAFWRSAHGWAPDNAADLLSESRLDWQVSLTDCLGLWTQHDQLSDGELILAWTNLGALVEGTMKLFFSIYYNDYLNDPQKDRKDRVINPDRMEFETLKVYMQKKNIVSDEIVGFLTKIQGYRNAIHAFRDRELGDTMIFKQCLCKYLSFAEIVEQRLPYP